MRSSFRFAALSVLIAVPVSAQRQTFTDEPSFLAALAAQGYVTVTEDFEDPETWGLLQTDLTQGTTAPSVLHAGIRWTGYGGGVALDSTTSKSPSWELSSSPAGFPRNGVQGTSSLVLHALGGWVRSSGFVGNDIELILDGDTQNPIGTHGQGVTGNFFFFGVIDTTGFSTFEFRTEPVAAPDPPKALFVDAFTFGLDASPPDHGPGPRWITGSGGTWEMGSNWDTGMPPTASECARFELASPAPYTVAPAAQASAGRLVLGTDRLRLDPTGASLDLTSTNLTEESIVVARGGTDLADLEIAGGTVTAVDASIAHGAATDGALTASLGASLQLSGTLRVGYLGSGRMDLLGGSVSSASSEIGRRGGLGTVAVAGVGSTWSAGLLHLGMGGTGALEVTGGASAVAGTTVTSELAGTGLSDDAPGSSTITVRDLGSRLDILGSATFGQVGPSDFTLTGGATASAYGLDAAVGGDANLTVAGPGTQLTIDNPGYYGVGTLRIGVGTLGGVITFPPPSSPVGTMTVTAGAQVVSEEAYVGNDTNGIGRVTLRDPGTLWTNSGNTFLGYRGDASIQVLDGAALSTGQGFVGRFERLGSTKGEVIVDGAGSRWDALALYIGFNNDVSTYSYVSEGVLTVRNAGLVTSTLGLDVAPRWTSMGTVRVFGPGSRISVGLDVSLGRPFASVYKSYARVELDDGGELLAGGTVWMRSGELDLGGGQLNAQAVNVASEASLTGWGTIGADVSNTGGTVGSGNRGPGTLQVQGNFQQNGAGRTIVEIGGTNPGEFQRFQVSGTATVAGTLEVRLSPGFRPRLGTRVRVLEAGDLQGRFQRVELSSPNLGLEARARYDATGVTLVFRPKPMGSVGPPRGGRRP
ncbi:MAG TPA: hypothetical protein ENJ09_05660 [Planctomycetes bacterium]|nr:hypothetical protein [Planctomycetota bacterium]